MITKISKKAIHGIVNTLGLNRANKISCTITEMLHPVRRVLLPGQKELKFACPNALALSRANLLFEKEPETIEWIDSFPLGSSLLDIGANVGVFSLYAAVNGHRVVSIEPESANYALLNENIYLNQLDGKMVGYNMALADRNVPSHLYLSTFGPAFALHTAGREEDYRHKQVRAAFRQGVLELTLDGFMAMIPDFFPTHIKIDVDGAEARIIDGASKTLRDARLKSVLIEINEELECDQEVVQQICKANFRQTSRSHSEMFNTGEFSKLYNYIFTR